MNCCGTDCAQCQFKDPCACGGCGTPFYGQCLVAQCAGERRLAHCGLCPAFPCQKLLSCAHDPFTGDGGKRLEACRKAKQ